MCVLPPLHNNWVYFLSPLKLVTGDHLLGRGCHTNILKQFHHLISNAILYLQKH